MVSKRDEARAAKLHGELYEFALSLPEAWEDHPWGETVIKVVKKIFVFLGGEHVTVKLPESGDHALSLPGAYGPGYNLGKHGWVGIPLVGLGRADGELLFDFVDESYRTVAPKKLVKQLDARFPEPR